MVGKLSMHNSADKWGWLSIVFHWVSAFVIVSMFALGFWMVELDYYSDWYRIAPDWHRSVGVLFMMLMVMRLLWRFYSKPPEALLSHWSWEVRCAHIIHIAFYVLVLLLLPTGYFITTAAGQSVWVFDWFSIPAAVTSVDNLEDIAGDIHKIIAYSMMALVVLHIAGALKHHLIDKDMTLKRMLGQSKPPVDNGG